MSLVRFRGSLNSSSKTNVVPVLKEGHKKGKFAKGAVHILFQPSFEI